jgi:hypothetical protein
MYSVYSALTSSGVHADEAFTHRTYSAKHCCQSQYIIPPFADQSPALPAHVRAAVEWIVEIGGGITEWRKQRFDDLARIAESVRPLSRKILATCPDSLSWVGGEDPNPAFACMVLEALDLPCVEWPAFMYKFGFSIVGDASPTGLWRPKNDAKLRASARTCDPGDLRVDAWAYTKSVMNDMEKSYEDARSRNDRDAIGLVHAAWDASVKEVNSKKSAKGPLTRSALERMFKPFDHTKCPRPVPRRAVRQGAGKIRPVDNGSHPRGRHNSAYSSSETVWLMPADFTAGVGRTFFDLYHARGEACPELVSSGDDEPNAYRNIPAAEPEFHVAIAVSPKSGKAMFFAMRGHAFGFAASVPNYCQKSAIISIASALLLAAPVAPYIDDFTTPETVVSLGPEDPTATGWRRFPYSAQAALWTMAGLLGSPLTEDPEKCSTAEPVSHSCGVETDLSATHISGCVRLRIKPQTRDKVLSIITAHRARGSLTPGDAASLKGKCGYIFGLVPTGRGPLLPLSNRATRHDGEASLSHGIMESFIFIERFLSDQLNDFVVRGTEHLSHKITVFSDASWAARPPLTRGLGFVAFVVFFPDGSSVYASAEVPQEVLALLLEHQKYIYQLEVMALCGTYFSLPIERFASCDILHFADNTAANITSIKGYAKVEDAALMVSAYNIQIARAAARIRIEYVPSKKKHRRPALAPPRTGVAERRH